MSGDGQEVDAEVVHAHRNLANGLGAIGVHQRAVSMGNLGDLGDGLDGTDLVVGVHDSDQQGIRADGVLHQPGVDHSVLVHGHKGHPKPLGFQPAADLGYRGVFDG